MTAVFVLLGANHILHYSKFNVQIFALSIVHYVYSVRRNATIAV